MQARRKLGSWNSAAGIEGTGISDLHPDRREIGV